MILIIDQERRQRISLDRELMQERHVALSKQILDKALEGLSVIDGKKLSPRDIARLADVGTRIQIRALGQPGEERPAVIEVNVMLDQDENP